MTDQQTKMWDILAELDGEEVLRVLTDWHGLQILDSGFYGHLVDEGYIEEPEEEDEGDNCEAGTYDCGSCPLDGVCPAGHRADETGGASRNLRGLLLQLQRVYLLPVRRRSRRLRERPVAQMEGGKG